VTTALFLLNAYASTLKQPPDDTGSRVKVFNLPYGSSVKTKLMVKCSACGFWNRLEAERLVAQQDTFEPEAKIVYPVYSPLKLETCKKCGKSSPNQENLSG
jgi:hypothetical protein